MELTPQLLLEKILAVFPGKYPQEILQSLNRYSEQPYEREQLRVHFAILKLCEAEQLSEPDKYVLAAKNDYRDVLAWAEYPSQMQAKLAQTPEESRESVEQDLVQYRKWLGKLDS